MTRELNRRLALLGLSSADSELPKLILSHPPCGYHVIAADQDITALPQPLPSVEPKTVQLDETVSGRPVVDGMVSDVLPFASDHRSDPLNDHPQTSASDASTIVTKTFSKTPGLDIAKGTPAQVNEGFCPLLTISKLCYKFISNKQLSQDISVKFFADGKFWRAGWTTYYIWPISNQIKPLLLVPRSEVIGFIQAITQAFPQAGLSLSYLSRKYPSLSLDFRSRNAHLRPRFLGYIRDQEHFLKLQHNIPGPNFSVPGALAETKPNPDDIEVKQFDLRISQAINLEANKKKRSSKHSTSKALEQLPPTDSLEIVEQFLGLRAAEPQLSDLVWDGAQAGTSAHTDFEASRALIDLSMPAPYPYDSNVIFVCVDVEAYERDTSKITEIGVSTLDTNDISALPPGSLARDWQSQIRAQHFRIIDHAHLRNGRFVSDNAGNFKFGVSEFISLDDTPRRIAACFRGDDGMTEGAGKKRTIVLVGHDVASDVRFLQRVGYDVSNLSTLHSSNPVIDTQKLFRAFQKIKNPSRVATGQSVSLATVMEEMDIAPFGLHNAGNDAAYTLQVMVGMAVESAQARQAVDLAGAD